MVNRNFVNQRDLEHYKALFNQVNVFIHNDALVVIAEMLKLDIPPDEIYSLLKQMAPVCGLLRKFKIKKSSSNDQSIR